MSGGLTRAVAWPKHAGGGGGGQCLLSKYQVAIPVLTLGIINFFLKTGNVRASNSQMCWGQNGWTKWKKKIDQSIM